MTFFVGRWKSSTAAYRQLGRIVRIMELMHKYRAIFDGKRKWRATSNQWVGYAVQAKIRRKPHQDVNRQVMVRWDSPEQIYSLKTTGGRTITFSIATCLVDPLLCGAVPNTCVAAAGIASGLALTILSGIVCGTKAGAAGTVLVFPFLAPGHSSNQFDMVATPAAVTSATVGSTAARVRRSEQWKPLPTKTGWEDVEERAWKSLDMVASRQGSSKIRY